MQILGYLFEGIAEFFHHLTRTVNFFLFFFFRDRETNTRDPQIMCEIIGRFYWFIPIRGTSVTIHFF